jgi:hypothetical protein
MAILGAELLKKMIEKTITIFDTTLAMAAPMIP